MTRSDPPRAPSGSRPATVTANRASGGYRVVSFVDCEGPEPAPGQFYAVAAPGPAGDAGAAAFPPRAIPVAETGPAAAGVRLDFLIDGADPGSGRLATLGRGEEARVRGPLGEAFVFPREAAGPGAAGAILVGGGVGVAPLALLRRRLAERAVPHRVLLGFRDEAHSGGLDLFCSAAGTLCPEVRLAGEDGYAGHRGPVTDLLATMLAGDDARSAVVYAGGPPAMLDAVRALCGAAGVLAQITPELPAAGG
jgi:NAD(P)H-flavin reductase